MSDELSPADARDRVRKLLLDQQPRLPHAPQGWFSKLVNFGQLPSVGTYVFEFANCNHDQTYIAYEENPINSWFIDRKGIQRVEETLNSISRETIGMWFRFRRVWFYIAP